MRDYLNEVLRGMGGDYEKAANSIIDKKYKIVKQKFNLRLCKMKSGKFKIMDYNDKNYGTYLDVNMAKKEYVELYEKQHGIIHLK